MTSDNRADGNSAPGRLIIVCGVGKTTYARKLAAIRFCPDEWMPALSIDLGDEARRAKVDIYSGNSVSNFSFTV